MTKKMILLTQHPGSDMNQKKHNLSVILAFLLLLFFNSPSIFADAGGDCTAITNNVQNSCYMASDFGFSTGAITVKSNNNQWVKFDPVLYSKGNDGASNANDIVLKVDGGWKPWGDLATVGSCIFNQCTETAELGCYEDGKEIDIGEEQKNIACCISDGYGLYGVISIDGSDPNQAGDTLNPANFMTFRVAPLEERNFKPSTQGDQTSQEITVKTFSLHNIEVWDPNTKQFTQKPIPKAGVLYFKIVDSYYGDNQGSYNVLVTNGAYSKTKGLIEQLMDFFSDTFHKSTDTLYNSIIKESGFRTVVRALLVLFISFTVIFFMIGLIEINQTELVVRLFKIGVISTLISDTTLTAVPSLFEGFVGWATSISNIIMGDSMYDPETSQSLLPFPDLHNVFSVYDGVINMVTSAAFNVKIWALLFTNKFYLVIGIYICVVVMFIAMFRSLVQYIMSFFLLAILIIILPIFLITILFKQTASLFDTWLDQFIGACLMIIIITATVALMLSLIITQLQDLLYYTVCWESIWKLTPLGITVIDFYFWHPDDWDQFSSAATPFRFFYILVSCVVFRVYMDYVPELVDALGGMAKQPFKNLYGGTSGSQGGIMANSSQFLTTNVYSNKYYQAFSKTALSPMKERLSPLYWVETLVPFMRHGAITELNTWTSDKVQKGMGVVDALHTNLTSNPQGSGLNVVNIANETKKGKDAFASFEELHGKYGYKLIGKPVVYAAVGTGKLLYKGGELAWKGGQMARDGLQNLWKGNPPIDQQNQEFMRGMLAEDKVILDQRLQQLGDASERLKSDKVDILGNQTILQETSNELIERGAQLSQARQDLEVLKVTKPDEYLVQETELTKQVKVWEQDCIAYNDKLDIHQDSIVKYQENIGEFTSERELVKQELFLYIEQKDNLDTSYPPQKDVTTDSNLHVPEQNLVDQLTLMQEEVKKSQEEIARLDRLDKLNQAITEELRKIK